MTFKEFITDTRGMFKEELNPFLAENGLKPVKVLDSGVRLHNSNRSLAIYPTSASGSTFEGDGPDATARFTLEFFCNEDSTEKGYVEVEDYYSAFIDFINKAEIGGHHTIMQSVICRMEEDWPANGCLFLIEAKVSSDMDAGWD